MSLPSFGEQSLCKQVSRRQLQRKFLARGLVSRDEARETGEYFEAASVHVELHGMLSKVLGGTERRQACALAVLRQSTKNG